MFGKCVFCAIQRLHKFGLDFASCLKSVVLLSNLTDCVTNNDINLKRNIQDVLIHPQCHFHKFILLVSSMPLLLKMALVFNLFSVHETGGGGGCGVNSFVYYTWLLTLKAPSIICSRR